MEGKRSGGVAKKNKQAELSRSFSLSCLDITFHHPVVEEGTRGGGRVVGALKEKGEVDRQNEQPERNTTLNK